MRGIFAGVVAVAVAALAAYLLLTRSGRMEAVQAEPAAIATRAAPPTALPAKRPRKIATAAAPAGAAQVSAPLPHSLVGTDVDGALPVDARGHLVLGPEVIRLFDYFLSATGEEPDELIRQRVLAEIQRRLHEPAASEARALFDQYLDYRAKGKGLSALDGDDLQSRLDAVKTLRREVFGADAEQQLFGDQEAVDAVAVERARIEADGALSPEQKRDREEALEAQLPERVRRERAETIAPLVQMQAEEELRREGATEEDLQHYREETAGPEAAQRLAALDQERARWQKRLSAFEAELGQIRASGLSPDAQSAEIQDALSREFDARERLRVSAIEHLGAN